LKTAGSELDETGRPTKKFSPFAARPASSRPFISWLGIDLCHDNNPHTAPAKRAFHRAPHRVDAVSGETLSRAIWLSGRVSPVPLCAGLGRCGHCRVRFVSNAPPPLPAEEDILSQNDIASGWRLACRRQAPDSPIPLDLELPPSEKREEAVAVRRAIMPEPLVVAVDLGTTSVCWQALVAEGARTGEIVAQGRFLNPQAGAGADVISRLALAAQPQGRLLLSSLVRDAILRVLDGLPGKISRLCVAGNTAMTDIFLDRDVSGLCAAPYRTTHNGDETVHLPNFPPIYIPPLPTPFVGGDITAGLAVLRMLNAQPLGTALEGIGLECGSLAGADTITECYLTSSGLAARSLNGASVQSARGISATGYISLLAMLLELKVLDSFGHFVRHNASTPLAAKVAADIAPYGQTLRLRLPYGLWLSASDVEELLKVKASFSLALEKLSAMLPLRKTNLYLTGALGERVNPDWLAALGFMPRGLCVYTAAIPRWNGRPCWR